MEIGHNVMHGQWNWMNDPEMDSSTWERDMIGTSQHWRFTHNFQHHKYTNILGMDDDVGYTVLRVTRDQPWERFNIGNLLMNTFLALGFEWGIGLQAIEFRRIFRSARTAQSTSSSCASFSPRRKGRSSRTTSRSRR